MQHIDKKFLTELFGYSNSRSIDSLIARHHDFPKPVMTGGGKAKRNLWDREEVIDWFKKYKPYKHKKE